MNTTDHKGNEAGLIPQVMIVDDEEYIRVLIAELLAYEGIGVVAANGCQQCLEILEQGFRGVILMDVMMQDKSGWDTIRAIDQAGMLPGNIIVMLTAMGAPDECMEGLQDIVIDYISKPFDADEFVITVRQYLGCLEQVHTMGV